jgi:hypothetical protein
MEKINKFWKANSLLPFFYGVVGSEELGGFRVQLEAAEISGVCLRIETRHRLVKGERLLFYTYRSQMGDFLFSARMGREFEKVMKILHAGEAIRVFSQGLEQEQTAGWVQVLSSQFEFLGLVPPSNLNQNESIATALDLKPTAICITPIGLSVIFSPLPEQRRVQLPEDDKQLAFDRVVHRQLLTAGSVVMAFVVDHNRDCYVLDYGSGVGKLPLGQLLKSDSGKCEAFDFGDTISVVVLKNEEGAITFTRLPFKHLSEERAPKKESRLSRFLQFLYWQFVLD